MATCRACHHANRDEIDRQLIAATPIRTIAATFQLSLGGLQRHKAHIRADLKNAARAASSERGSELLGRIEEVVRAAKGIAGRAVRADDLRAANGALTNVLRSLELIGKLTGELQTPGAGLHIHSTKNITTTVNVIGEDTELAELCREALNNWDESTIIHFKALAPPSASGAFDSPRNARPQVTENKQT